MEAGSVIRPMTTDCNGVPADSTVSRRTGYVETTARVDNLSSTIRNAILVTEARTAIVVLCLSPWRRSGGPHAETQRAQLPGSSSG